jgi:hypothetical protein
LDLENQHQLQQRAMLMKVCRSWARTYSLFALKTLRINSFAQWHCFGRHRVVFLQRLLMQSLTDHLAPLLELSLLRDVEIDYIPLTFKTPIAIPFRQLDRFVVRKMSDTKLLLEWLKQMDHLTRLGIPLLALKHQRIVDVLMNNFSCRLVSLDLFANKLMRNVALPSIAQMSRLRHFAIVNTCILPWGATSIRYLKD